MNPATEGFYHCHLDYPELSAKAVTGYGYIARADEHVDRPDQVLHLEHGNMPPFAIAIVGAPDYWTTADQYSRSNARKFFPIEVALPRQLTLNQQIRLTRAFAKFVATLSDNLYALMPYTFAIHSGYGSQPHAHIQVSPALNDGLVRPAEQWFRRYNPMNPGAGGAPKCRVITYKSWLLELRKQWERCANVALREAGSPLRVDHRTNLERGMNRIPTIPVGPPMIHGRPNKSREIRLQRNREIEEENLRRDADALRAKHDIAIRARRALLDLPGNWWGKRARSPKLSWQSFSGRGVGVLDKTTAISRKDKWTGLSELVQEPAYIHAANNWLGDDWVAGACGPFTVWLHPNARPLIDCGGAICTIGTGLLEANAIATLLHSRGTEKVKIKGSLKWSRRLMDALTQFAVRAVPRKGKQKIFRPAHPKLPAPAPKGRPM